MGKKKGGKKADDYWENEFEQDAEVTGATTVAFDGTTRAVEPLEGDAAAPAEEDGEGLMAMMKKATKKKEPKAQEQDPPAGDDDGDDDGGRVKSKKEKERERKERQKMKKKDQKPGNSAPKGGANTPPAAVQTEAAPSSPPAADDAAAKKKGGKKKGPPVAALREFLAAKQAAEEEARRLEEEAAKAEEERLRKIQEEDEEKERQRQLKKEKEKARKERLRQEGKLLSEAEKKRRQMNQLKLDQLRAQGVIVPALEEGAAPVEEKKPKRVVYDNRKKKRQNDQETKPAAEKPQEAKKEEVVESWEEVAESWEEIGEEKTDAAADGIQNLNLTEESSTRSGTPVNENTENDNDNSSDDDEDEQTDSSDDSDEGDETREEQLRKADARARRQQRHEQAVAARSEDDLRSPICVILGHVDTGKTKLLDKIRQTNVQEGEAGGITQQIGATYFPTDALKQKTAVVLQSDKYTDISEKTGFRKDFEFKVPGLLVIDTPGHESFTNLRSRGSSLCNIAILVIDIMHGLEAQTIESINLLKQRKTPFIVALNKIDRIYGWKEIKNNAVLESLAVQPESVIREFDERVEATKLALAEQGLNAELYYKNPDVRKYASLVPTSAVTGEGVPDLLSLLVQLTQDRLTERLMYLSELEATVLEVKVVEGLGTTIDVILSNGVLHEGDRIVVCGLNGPISTNIRALLTPQPMRELRVKSAYVHHKEIKAAMGVKISAPDLEKAIAGSRLLVVTPEDDEDELRDEVMSDLTTLFDSVDKSGHGVCVQASTLGSLEALLSFLKDSKIPVAGINIGPVYKKDVIRASVMLEHAKEMATILAFDVKIDRDAQELAESAGVKIFRADIIYHLFDQFTAYMKNITDQRKKDMAPQAVWPCWLKIVPGCVFNKTDPIIVGVDVLDGTVRIGTPLCVPGRGNVVLGKVAGIEANHKAIELAKKGQQVAIRIECPSYETNRVFGRHFSESDEIVSRVTRQSIDVLKESFRTEVSKDEWLLVKRLKPLLGID